MRSRAVRRLVIALVVVMLAASACSSSSKKASPSDTTVADATTTVPAAAKVPVVFNGQGNDLAAYLSESPFTKQIVIHHHDDAHPDGLDINGQICFDPADSRRFIAGEDTLQDTTGHPGWGIFALDGDAVGSFSARELGKLVPTYQPSNDNPENYGCGWLSDGRVLTTDIGNQANGQGDGQLIVWFPPLNSRSVKYCKLDVHLTTAQGLLVDGNALYLAQARPPTAGVYKYDITTFPTSDQPSGGCDGKDATGAPLATRITSTMFIKPSGDNSIVTPNAIAKAPDGTLFVSSVFNGVIAQFSADGKFKRVVLKPPAGETLGAEPFSTGTPLGVGVAPDGSVFYADIGIVIGNGSAGPGNKTGHLRRVAFDKNGEPQAPDDMDKGLAFPDGIGIWTGDESS
jgi:hypothetical protein